MRIIFLRVIADREEDILEFFDFLKQNCLAFENNGIKPAFDEKEFRGYCVVSVERKGEHK